MFLRLSSTRPSVLCTTARLSFICGVTPVPASRTSTSFASLPSSSVSLPDSFFFFSFLPLPALPSAASSAFSSSNLPVAISSAFLMAWFPTSFAISSMFIS